MVVIAPIFALAWWEAAARLSHRFAPRRGHLFVIAVILMLVPGFFRCLNLWREQYRRPYIQYVNNGTYLAISELAGQLRQLTPPDAVFIVPERTDRVLAYMSDRWTVAHDQIIPPNFRQHPVYVVYGNLDDATRQHLHAW